MPLSETDVGAVVSREVGSVRAIDVHTHLLPPTHGGLMLFGIDHLLTYHYLIAETFMVLPAESDEDGVSHGADAPPSPDEFFAWPVARQAELVFEELFVRRTPLSEACRGVVTVLSSLGLGSKLREAAALRERPAAGRLAALREWFAAQEPAAYLEKVFEMAGLRYAVMTNIPFSPEEAPHWMPGPDGAPPPPVTDRLKTALRVDPVLAGDWAAVSAALRRSATPYAESLEGVRQYLKDWVERIRPMYLMASTPAGFRYTPSSQHGKRKRGNGAAEQPAQATADGSPSATQLLEEGLLAVAMEHKLPIALKLGAVRGANPSLRSGGDAVEVADLSFIRQLCLSYPSVKFLVTVLSQANQHELCVLARKFGNLHIYGCWWFCNNPSIIESTTRMRLEMLGSAFTAQHSDARILDQLLYKWKHSREAIAPVLTNQYQKLIAAGWELSEADVKSDVALLFGGAFEAFLAK